MDKFRDKFKIQSARLFNYDYGSPGIYFITVCTKNRKPYFGEIISSKMNLNLLGSYVVNEWRKTVEIRADMKIKLGEFVVMPNHFHGIIIIGENHYNKRNAAIPIIAEPISSENIQPKTQNKFGPQQKNIASIIRGFKSSVTIFARKSKLEFDWQERFYDHIIHKEADFQYITNYIINNPDNWKDDKFYQDNIASDFY